MQKICMLVEIIVYLYAKNKEICNNKDTTI